MKIGNTLLLTLGVCIIMFSCEGRSNNKNTTEERTVIENEKTTEDLDYSKPVSVNDNPRIIKKKLQVLSELDGLEFGELNTYDDYFQSEVTKYYLKRKTASERYLTVVIYNDTIRYTKMLIEHFYETKIKDRQDNKMKMINVLNQMIETGTYSRQNNGFINISENGENWNVAWLYTENNKINRQTYWLLMTPESEITYLEHMTNAFVSIDEIKAELL